MISDNLLETYLAWFYPFWIGGLALGLYVESREFIECVWPADISRDRLPPPEQGRPPFKVSIHVPCCNEPADMVIRTLNGLAALDYDNYEVLVIDNNTADPALWQPVQAHCQTLGSRFRFYHVPVLAGFKAGALNYLLDRVAADADVIAVVDADYLVAPDWLARTVPYFAHRQLALFQCPQDYRDERLSAFKLLCHYEYQLFFKVGMVVRNTRNAIIQHGTMTLIRRSVLDTLRWAEWCICEDAELGLRILEQGHETFYTPQSMGQGLTPDTFTDFKRQRFRWAYGAVQILKSHARPLLTGRGSRLTRSQRYYFVGGWLPWLAEGAGLVTTAAVLLRSFWMVLTGTFTTPAPLLLTLPLVTLVVLKFLKMTGLYVRVNGLQHRDAFYATLAGISLTHTIGKAVIVGLVTRRMPFYRTPKQTRGSVVRAALLGVREELSLLGLLLVAFSTILTLSPAYPMATVVWLVLIVQLSLGYWGALVMALMSTRPVALAAAARFSDDY